MKNIQLLLLFILIIPLWGDPEVERETAWAVFLQRFQENGKWQDVKESFIKVISIPELRDGEAWQSEKNNKLKAMLVVYKTLIAKINYEYDENEDVPVMSVSPPIETKLRPGVSPDLISDPELKRIYIKSIKANNDKKSYRNNQLMYRQIMIQIVAYVESYIKRNYTNDDMEVVGIIVQESIGISYHDFIESSNMFHP